VNCTEFKLIAISVWVEFLATCTWHQLHMCVITAEMHVLFPQQNVYLAEAFHHCLVIHFSGVLGNYWHHSEHVTCMLCIVVGLVWLMADCLSLAMLSCSRTV